MSAEIGNGDRCIVTGGTHRGKASVAHDRNVSATGQVTITVVQDDGNRFKTLARNVSVQA